MSNAVQSADSPAIVTQSVTVSTKHTTEQDKTEEEVEKDFFGEGNNFYFIYLPLYRKPIKPSFSSYFTIQGTQSQASTHPKHNLYYNFLINFAVFL